MSINQALLEDPFAFEVVRLEGCMVILDAEDFAQFIIDALPQSVKCDNLHFTIALSVVLRRLKVANITPIFVLPGFTANYLLKPTAGDREHLSISSIKTAAQYLPILASVLSYLGVHHVVVEEPITAYAASLAVHLSAPLLASKPAYYFVTPDVVQCERGAASSLAYMPLCFSEFKHTLSCVGGNTSTPMVNASSDTTHVVNHVFRPELSILCRIGPLHRPLLALLVGVDEDTIKWPIEIAQTPGEPSTSATKLESAVKWLAGFQADSVEPLFDILKNYPSEERAKVRDRILADHTKFYCDSYTVGAKVATCLPSTFHLPSKQPNYDFVGIAKLYHNCRLILMKDLTIDWPVPLVSHYRNSQFMPSLLTALYNSDGVYLYPPENSIAPVNSIPVYAATLPIRYLCYRLLANRGKCLENIKPTEQLVYDNILLKYNVVVEPFHLSPEHATAGEVFAKIFKLPLPIHEVSPDWLFTLAFVLTFWYQCGGIESTLQPSSDEFEAPDRSPLLLAVAASAVTSVYNLDHLTSALPNYYEKLIDFLSKDVTEFRTRNPNQNDYCCGEDYQVIPQEVKDQFTALQLHYSYLNSLVVLIKCLLPSTGPDVPTETKPSSSLVSILPAWVAFPSSRLVYWLAVHLNNQPAAIRLEHVMHYWIPRLLLRSRVQEQQGGASMAYVTELFERLINLVMTVLPLSLDELIPALSVSSSTGKLSVENPVWLRNDQTEQKMKAGWYRGQLIGVSDEASASVCRRGSRLSDGSAAHSSPAVKTNLNWQSTKTDHHPVFHVNESTSSIPSLAYDREHPSYSSSNRSPSQVVLHNDDENTCYVGKPGGGYDDNDVRFASKVSSKEEYTDPDDSYASYTERSTPRGRRGKGRSSYANQLRRRLAENLEL